MSFISPNLEENTGKQRSPLFKWLLRFVWLGLAATACTLVAGVAIWQYYAQQVPDFRTLADYHPSLITKFYDRNGEVIVEYAKERRIYTPINSVPTPVIRAFLAAEDTGFYHHKGFDLKAIVRAALVTLFTERIQGASTITQQVAKTFLLSSERTIDRKIKELILSVRIENTFTKDEILELYLNQIYLGNGAYGIAAAARGYFGKNLSELTLSERAFIAGLPKAPSRYNPLRYPERAMQRRNTILQRMEVEGMISPELAAETMAQPLELSPTNLTQGQQAPHFSEYVRRQLLEQYTEHTLYTGGLRVHTTLDLSMQKAAAEALWQGLRDYDRRHGWRGAVQRIENLDAPWADVREKLEQIRLAHSEYSHLGDPVLVTDVNAEQATIKRIDGQQGYIPLAQLKWARPHISPDERGPEVRQANDVLHVGDVVFAQPLPQKTDNRPHFSLEQLPRAQGALLAQDAHTGGILAMVGGLGAGDGFNRAIQGKRQAGSVFKPFVYATALNNGYTPATVILDAPVVFRDGAKSWKPSNYSTRIHGPSTLRRGLEKSRNLMTIRLAQEVGMQKVALTAQKFGLEANIDPQDLTMALGAASFSLQELVNAYGVFPNHGKLVNNFAIARLQDNTGQTLAQQFTCKQCDNPENRNPQLTIPSRQVLSPQVAYQMTSMLEGVIERGTARSLRGIGTLGGKTGTTNDYKDAWFVGFSPDIVAGVWVGFDQPQTLGHGEAGGRVAGPIFGEFMRKALAGKSKRVFQTPPDMTFVRIDNRTGKRPTPQTTNTFMEAFIKGTEPKAEPENETQPGLPGTGVGTYGLF